MKAVISNRIYLETTQEYKEFLDKEVHLWDEHKWYVEQRKKDEGSS